MVGLTTVRFDLQWRWWGERGWGGSGQGGHFKAAARSQITANFIYVVLLTMNVVRSPIYANEKLFL